MLAWTIYLSFLGAVAVTVVPARYPGLVRAIALLSTGAGLAIALTALMRDVPSTPLTTIVRIPWIPSLGIEYYLAADGISLTLVLLTGIAAIAGVLFSWNVEQRVREFFAFYLVLIGAVYGVFLSFDLFLLFVFYEIAIVPKYFLIAIWGSTGREYAAMKLVLYSFAGSALVLGGVVAAYVVAGKRTLNLETLNLETLTHHPYPVHFQLWAFPLVFVGFAVLAGMWPFHTWAPTGHAAAPTAASMLLAGVVMKLGAYGCLRVAMMLFPRGMDAWGCSVLGFGSWAQVFAVLGTVGIVYGAAIALVQRDLKLVIGYSSISHMGFVILGLMTLTQVGLSGAVFQMFSHGIIACLLFAVTGRMVYDRTHTRKLAALSHLPLSRMIPFAAVTFVLAMMASLGLPGFSGFIAELQVLIGAWTAFPWLVWIAGVGILIVVAFSWRALQATFFGKADLSGESTMAAISLPERLGAGLLLASTLLLGLYPRFLMRWIVPSLHGPLFEQLRRGTWR